MTAQKVAVATVSSDAFAIGTLVTLWSFVQANPWFDGEIHVFTESLSRENRTLLEDFVPGIRFAEPSGAIARKLDALIAARPELADRRARFLSLEAFRLPLHDRLLFFDSDLLFTGSLAPLLAQHAALIACPDGAALRSAGRDSETFARRRSGGTACFNSGLMVIDPARLEADVYDRLLESVDADTWRAMVTDHTDQFLLNRAFAGAVTFAGCEYNLLLAHRAAAFEDRGLRVADARVLHFNGPAKPWLPAAMLKAARRDAALLSAWRMWQEALEKIVAGSHLSFAR